MLLDATVFVQTQGTYAQLKNDNILLTTDDNQKTCIPLVNVGDLVVFGNVGVSPALIRKMADTGKSITFLDFYGNFKARTTGRTSPLALRTKQYDLRVLPIAKEIVEAKTKNQIRFLSRSIKDTNENKKILNARDSLYDLQTRIHRCRTVEALRGLEGASAATYFSVFGDAIKNSNFVFEGRNKRPPKNATNALLSFTYALYTKMCVSACEIAGLDPYYGFLHEIRPGRPSLALDLVEEFRPVADRFVVSVINLHQISIEDFNMRPGPSCVLTNPGRVKFLSLWNEHLQSNVDHPLSTDPIPLGYVATLQARAFAKRVRGDTESYRGFSYG